VIQRKVQTDVVDDLSIGLKAVDEGMRDIGSESLVESVGIWWKYYRFRHDAPS